MRGDSPWLADDIMLAEPEMDPKRTAIDGKTSLLTAPAKEKRGPGDNQKGDRERRNSQVKQ